MRSNNPRRAASGATLAEAIVAAGALMMLFAGLFALSAYTMRLLQSNREQSAATFCLQQRIEQMRRLTWAQVTDGAYLRDNVLNSAADATASLQGAAEQLSVNAYPTATTANLITRPAGGPASLQTSNTSLASATAVRIDASVTWPKRSGGIHTRQYTAVLTNGGILK